MKEEKPIKLKDDEIGMDFLVELVSQAVISFPPIKESDDYPDPADLIHNALTRDLIDLSKFKPVYMNYTDAEYKKGKWDAGSFEWKDMWPFNLKRVRMEVLHIDLNSKPKKNKHVKTITVEVEAPKDYTDDDIIENLKLALLSTDGEQHLETMNRERDPNIKFTIK